MTVVRIDALDVLGEAPERGDKVIFQAKHVRGSAGKPGGVVVPRPRIVDLVAGVAEVDIEPGVVLVKFRCGTPVDTAPIEVNVPSAGSVTLRDLLEQVFEYEPPVVSEVSRLVAEARRIGERLGSATQIDGWVSSASRDAGTAVQAAGASEEAAGRAEGSATAAGNAATAAGDAEGRAGQSAATASTKAGEASTSAQSADASATTADTSATNAKTSETKTEKSATEAATSATDAATSATMAGTKAGEAAGSATTASQKAGEAAASAESAADSERRAGDIAAAGVPDATTTAKGKLRLAGDLGGTADAPTVPKLADKADKQAMDTALAGKSDNGHKHVKADVTDLPAVTTAADGNALVQRTGSGQVTVPATPSATTDAGSKSYVDAQDATVLAKVQARPAFFSGAGTPPASIPGAVAGDLWWNTTTNELYKITGV